MSRPPAWSEGRDRMLEDRLRIKASSTNLPITVGAQAAASWLSSRRLANPGLMRWHVEIAMGTGDQPVPVEFDERVATRLHIAIINSARNLMHREGPAAQRAARIEQVKPIVREPA